MIYNTTVLLWVKSWTVWYTGRYSMSTYTGVTNCQKTVRFFWPTLYKCINYVKSSMWTVQGVGELSSRQVSRRRSVLLPLAVVVLGECGRLRLHISVLTMTVIYSHVRSWCDIIMVWGLYCDRVKSGCKALAPLLTIRQVMHQNTLTSVWSSRDELPVGGATLSVIVPMYTLL